VQAAVTAADRGHDVILFEKDLMLGGSWRRSSAATLSVKLTEHVDSSVGETLRLRVDPRLDVT
jgi:hypothetical protein